MESEKITNHKTLLHMYQLLAHTMETLIEIQKLEDGQATDQNEAPTSEVESSLVEAKPVIQKRRNLVGLFDEDFDDIKRKDQVNVFVHIEVVRMGEVDTKNQKFESEINIFSRWLEPELDRKHALYANKPPTEYWDFWDPHLFVVNAATGSKEKTTYSVFYDQFGIAMVEEKRHIRGYFKSSLELYDYPFDVQDLLIKVGSSRSLRELCFKVDPVFKSTMNTDKFSGHQEWKLDDRIKIKPTTFIDVMKMGRQVKPAITMYFKTKRHGMYFVWNVIVFIIVISSLAFSTFSIDCTNLPARLPLTFILLLSNVTFKFAVTKSLPKISYLTYMDNYVLTSLIIMVVLSMWHTAIATIWNYTEATDKKLAIRADYVAMAILCVIYIVFNSTFIAKIKYTVRRARKQKEKLKWIMEEHIKKVTTHL